MPPQQESMRGDRTGTGSSSVNVPVVSLDEDDAPHISFLQRRSSSRVHFSQMQELDVHPRIRQSVVRRESFIVQFAKSKGPPQITFIMMLIAVGLGSTIGVVPAVMADRFARLQHGYSLETPCSSWSVDEKPAACFAGSGDAQTAVASSNFISNVLTFLTSSVIGSMSDAYGRKGILILGLVMGMLSPLMLVLIQLIPSMSPWWYYGCNASTGLVNWIAVALSALADVLPQRFRAPGIGLLLAGFMLGFSLSPILALLLSNLHLAMSSFLVVGMGLLATIFLVPETLPQEVAEEARSRRHAETLQQQTLDELDSDETRLGQWKRALRVTFRFLTRPFQEMSILNRDSFFRLISLLAFFSGMVSSGDQVLLVYYLEERLGFTKQDVSVMFLIIGIMGLFAQGVLLKPLNDCLGEKRVVAFCFLIGAIDNTMYGLARNKSTIYAAVALSALTGMAFPTISAIKANNVAITEQGRIQGALYSLQALASGVGPVLLRLVYSRTKDSFMGPGAMFVFAASLYLVAVFVACALPSERANARTHYNDDGDEGDDDDVDNIDDAFFHQLIPSSSDESPGESYGSIAPP